jgi:hypothetical protein
VGAAHGEREGREESRMDYGSGESGRPGCFVWPKWPDNRPITIDGWWLSGWLLAQAGQDFPGPGPGCAWARGRGGAWLSTLGRGLNARARASTGLSGQMHSKAFIQFFLFSRNRFDAYLKNLNCILIRNSVQFWSNEFCSENNTLLLRVSGK